MRPHGAKRKHYVSYYVRERRFATEEEKGSNERINSGDEGAGYRGRIGPAYQVHEVADGEGDEADAAVPDPDAIDLDNLSDDDVDEVILLAAPAVHDENAIDLDDLE